MEKQRENQTKENSGKKKKKTTTEKNIQELWTTKYVVYVYLKYKKEKTEQNIFEAIMTENFPKLMSDTKIQDQGI